MLLHKHLFVNFKLYQIVFIIILYFNIIILTEIDREGCIEPDNDEPQQMGDASIEVNNELLTSNS